MADTMQFDLVSPERRLVSVPVREVRLPGTDGDLTAMPGHAATIVTLRPGIVTVVDAQGTATEFAVTGGFAEINGESVSLLAERGHPRAELTQDLYNEMMRDAHRAHRAALLQRQCRRRAPGVDARRYPRPAARPVAPAQPRDAAMRTALPGSADRR